MLRKLSNLMLIFAALVIFVGLAVLSSQPDYSKFLLGAGAMFCLLSVLAGNVLIRRDNLRITTVAAFVAVVLFMLMIVISEFALACFYANVMIIFALKLAKTLQYQTTLLDIIQSDEAADPKTVLVHLNVMMETTDKVTIRDKSAVVIRSCEILLARWGMQKFKRWLNGRIDDMDDSARVYGEQKEVLVRLLRWHFHYLDA